MQRACLATFASRTFLRTYGTQRKLVMVERDGIDDRVAIVTLNNPEKLNALSEAMGQEFSGVINDLCASPSSGPRAVVITGAGKAFSAGGDLKFLEDCTKPETAAGDSNVYTMLRFYESFLCLRRLPVPVIAAINGSAIGAGLAMTLAADIRIAAANAKMGLNFAQLGLHPGMGSTHFLPLLIGHQAAAHLLLGGGLVDGATAEKIGMVLKAVPAEQVLPNSLDIARNMANASPVAVRTTVMTLRAQRNVGLENALMREAAAQAQCYTAPDLMKALNALQSKVPPKF